MARVCFMCGKKAVTGNNVSHALNRTKRRFYPNFQKTTMLIDGSMKQIEVCTRCLKTMSKNEKVKTSNEGVQA